MTESAATTTTYRLAPAMALRLLGHTVVAVAVMVALTTVIGLLTGTGWAPAAAMTVLGVLMIGFWGWWLTRHVRAVQLTPTGYEVAIRGVGVRSAPWTQVQDVLAASPGGRPCLVIRLADGGVTQLPMAAVAGDRDAFAHDVRRRVRDAHS